MAIDRTNPTLLSNYFWFPCGVESRNWCDTAKKVAAIAIHIGLAYLTYGLFTAVTIGKYLFERRGGEGLHTAAQASNARNSEPFTASVQLAGSKKLTSVKFHSVDDLKEQIQELIGPKQEIYSVVHAGRNILEQPLRVKPGERPVLHPLTVPVYTADEFTSLLTKNPFFGQISRRKPVATEQTGAPVMRTNWYLYNPQEQKQILDSFSLHLSQKTGEKITVKAGEGANMALLFYSEEHLTELATAAGKSLKGALEIIGSIQNTGTEGMDFIYLAFGDLFNGQASIADLTARGKRWYQDYHSK